MLKKGAPSGTFLSEQQDLGFINNLGKFNERIKADRQRLRVLNIEVWTVVTVVECAKEEEASLASMFSDATNQPRAVFRASWSAVARQNFGSGDFVHGFFKNVKNLRAEDEGRRLAHSFDIGLNLVGAFHTLNDVFNVFCHKVIDFLR